MKKIIVILGVLLGTFSFSFDLNYKEFEKYFFNTYVKKNSEKLITLVKPNKDTIFIMDVEGTDFSNFIKSIEDIYRKEGFEKVKESEDSLIMTKEYEILYLLKSNISTIAILYKSINAFETKKIVNDIVLLERCIIK